MALFGKKKGDDSSGDDPSSGRDGFMPAPDKAAAFYKHARTVHDTGNYEYATTLWLQGLRLDPASMSAHESFFVSAQAFIAAQKKFGPTKDQARAFGYEKGRNKAVEKYLAALLDWGTRPLDPVAGVKAMEAGADVPIDLSEQVYWIGERTLGAALNEKKPRKDVFVRIMGACKKVGAFDLAVKAGEQALRLDRTDAALDDEVRNLSAQATMSKGGYEVAGKEGGFRSSIRDAEAQRTLREAEETAKSGTAAERSLEAARKDYESRPEDTHAIQRYVRELLSHETPEYDNKAQEILDRAYKGTSEFRFRQAWGDVEMRKGRRALREARAALEKNPKDAAARAAVESAAQSLLETEINEFRERTEAYPTNLEWKFELGRRLYDAGRHKDAITLLQKAQDDPKRRAQVLDYLARCFLAIGFNAEAIEVFQSAIEAAGKGGLEISLDLRYGLMLALQNKAVTESDFAAAEEAGRIASSIAMQQIDYKDIIERRQAIQKLMAELRGGGVTPA